MRHCHSLVISLWGDAAHEHAKNCNQYIYLSLLLLISLRGSVLHRRLLLVLIVEILLAVSRIVVVLLLLLFGLRILKGTHIAAAELVHETHVIWKEKVNNTGSYFDHCRAYSILYYFSWIYFIK